jgi:hypothetical protein
VIDIKIYGAGIACPFCKETSHYSEGVLNMKKPTISALLAILLLLVSCERLDQIPDIPELPDSTEGQKRESSLTRRALYFRSEKELLEYFDNWDIEQDGPLRTFDNERPTHYYKLKNPPTGAEFNHITVWDTIKVAYHMETEDSDEPESISVSWSPRSKHWGSDIETLGIWIDRPFPEESYICELDGITYYITKWGGGEDAFFWEVKWYNTDGGYHMFARFPLRFTVDEMLGYVSDLERVEIG